MDPTPEKGVILMSKPTDGEGFEDSTLSSKKTRFSIERAAKSAALSPDLQKIVDAWGDLPNGLRGAILAIVGG
jgi:hypothetical protein